ncbi:MAG TPA: PDGLE domain-containing protein [Micromonosporaceae bacterium]|nr:PDGLE domain-containing protein [Micromonosporaceae bacterium]
MRRTTWFILGGLLVALLLAGVVSNFASGSPDGLDSASTKGCTVNDDGEITGGDCIARGAEDHELGDSPLADYGIRGVDNAFLSTGLSGVAGVVLTFAIGGGVFWLVRRRRPEADPAPRPESAESAERAEPAEQADPARDRG